jgi:trehalose/maltose hydrolase-like predicted phosphorylase
LIFFSVLLCIPQIHISGDIAFAIQQHFRLTNDVQFLREIGFPLLSGIADFWVSRSETDQPGGVVHLRDVIGPDEDADHVDDSVYTNTGTCLHV